MTKEVRYRSAAVKALRKMPRNSADLIRSKVRQYAEDPASLANNVTGLSNLEGAIRLRVGDWRVVMHDGIVIEVVKIAPRGEVYNRKGRK